MVTIGMCRPDFPGEYTVGLDVPDFSGEYTIGLDVPDFSGEYTHSNLLRDLQATLTSFPAA